MKKILMFTALIVMSTSLLAQRGGGKFNPENMPKDGSLTGKILDANTKQPIPYANLGLYSMRDSSIIGGAITDENGYFKMSDLRYGRHYLVVNFMGYEKKTIQNIRINPQSKDSNVGTVILDVTSTDIDEVEVVAERTTVAFKIDKKVVNVGQDLQSSGGSAVDVLESVPSVEVDIDGNVALRGSSNFTVLIDGKPSVITGSDALQQIPSSAIQNIEIITNPSAKYDPDGMAGIINIVMKKQKLDGFNGIINASAGTGHKYTADATFNYRTKKANFVLAGNYRDRIHNGTRLSQQEIYSLDTTYLSSNGDRNHNRGGYGIKFGSDIFLTSNQTLTLSAGIGQRKFGRTSENMLDVYNTTDLIHSYTQNADIFEITGNTYNLQADYEIKFEKPEQKLNLSAYYSLWDGQEAQTQVTDTTNSNWVSLNGLKAQHNTSEQTDRMNWRAQVDYIQPFGNNKLEIGAQARHDYELSDYLYLDYDPFASTWSSNTNYTNIAKFTRDIYSGYFLWSGMAGGFGYKVGLRGEYTNRIINQETTGQKYTLDTINLFPSVHISKKLWAEQQLQLSYSRRIERPRRWYLNPFPNYSDGYSVRIGNPDLHPEYVDSYELSYQKRIAQSFVAVEVYHRKTTGKIERVTYLNDEGLIVRTVDNLTKDFATGVELTANIQFSKAWRANLTGNFFQYKIDGQILDQDVAQTTETWSTRFNTDYKISKTNTRFQFSAFYTAPSITSQGSRDAFFFTNFAVKQDLLKRKLSATFSVRDIFQTMKHSFETTSPELYSFTEFTRESPVFSIALSYKLNNYNERKRGNGSNGGDMMDEDF